MKKISITLICIIFVIVSYGQKGYIQISAVGGYERFTSVHTPLNKGSFIQLDLKSYITDQLFIINTLGYGFLNNEKKELLFNPYNETSIPVELIHTTWGRNVYASIGVGFDFLRLANNKHKFYTSLQGGVAHIERSDKFGYYDSLGEKPLPYNFKKGPELSLIGTLAVGYDFYIIPALSVGVIGSYAAGSFGDIPNMGLRIGYTF